MAKRREDVQVGEIQKRDNSTIRATLTYFRGELYVDFREYVKTESYDGPTKRGVRFHVENWESFQELVKQTDQSLQQEIG